MEEAYRQGLTVEAIIAGLKRGVTEAMHPLRPDQPDNYNCRGFVDLAMKLYGAYAPTKIDVDVQKKKVSIEITAEMIERLERFKKTEADLGGERPGTPEDDTNPLIPKDPTQSR